MRVMGEATGRVLLGFYMPCHCGIPYDVQLCLIGSFIPTNFRFQINFKFRGQGRELYDTLALGREQPLSRIEIEITYHTMVRRYLHTSG